MAARWEISDGSCDSLLVADEVHRFGAATFRLGLEEAFTKRLGISATWERPDGATETVHKPYFGGVVFTLSFSRARQEDIIAKFNLALIGVSLQGKEADDYNDLGEEIRRRRRQLENQFDAPEKDEDFFLWLQGARKGRDSGAAKVVGFYDSAITKRRKLLTEAGGKAEVVADAARAINREKRVIIFTETTDAADKIAKSWSSQNRACKPYHTGISKQIQEETLRAFSKGDLTSIAVAKKFDEGVDIPDADVAFIASTSRSDTQLVQRAGRVLRKKGDSREALIVLLYAINTVEDPEKGTLSKALEDLEGAAKQTRRVHWQGSFIDILSCFGKKWV
jgi:superfamily II DNA or RNA helicase